ncbi:hypothetical protein K438DRAFT_1964284 [Mycena galopus ATCC 62051]|nr:hypothetical protein K438DRAFT_1964284 [Mycena galopus ATCC 62051]
MSGASSSSHKIPPTVVIPSAALTEPQPKQYVCEDCDKAFVSGGHLTRHRLVHSGEMKYACTFPGCTTRCARKDNLRQHYRIHYEVRDLEELKRIAPEKRRRKTRVARANTVEVPGQWSEYVPGSSGGRRPRSTNPADSHPTSHSPSPSFSGSDDGSASYGSPQSSPYRQERLPPLSLGQAQYVPARGDYIPTGYSPSVQFGGNNSSISSPVQARYEAPTRTVPTQPWPSVSGGRSDRSFPPSYPSQLPSPSSYPQAQDAYPYPQQQMQYMSFSTPGTAHSFARPGYGAAYLPSYERGDQAPWDGSSGEDRSPFRRPPGAA